MKKLVWKQLKILILVVFLVVLYTIVFGLIKDIEVTEPYSKGNVEISSRSISEPFVCDFIYARQDQYQDHCGFIRNFHDKTGYMFHPKLILVWLPQFLLMIFVAIFGVSFFKKHYKK